MPARSFQYDHPHYMVLHTHDTGVFDVGSATEFARFSSKFQCIVRTIDVIVRSAASVASAIITVLHNGSVYTLLTFDSANTLGRVRTQTLNRTLLTVSDRLGCMHDQGGGEYQVVYSYQVLPLSEAVTV